MPSSFCRYTYYYSLFTRLAAFGIAEVAMMRSNVDITGRNLGNMNISAWFGQSSDSLLIDQRLFWMALFAILITKGADPISLGRMYQNN
ncbi:MAG: hypothetical protein N2B02_06175 [Amylibacter sp.]